MRNTIEEFGTNAGKVFKELEFNGPLNREKIIKKTRLSNEDFSAAIGWLARENKIFKDGLLYKIGETNLIEKIGEDIWYQSLISGGGILEVFSICQYPYF